MNALDLDDCHEDDDLHDDDDDHRDDNSSRCHASLSQDVFLLHLYFAHEVFQDVHFYLNYEFHFYQNELSCFSGFNYACDCKVICDDQ